MNKDESVFVTKSSFNVANLIAAIALLLPVLGLLKWVGASPLCTRTRIGPGCPA